MGQPSFPFFPFGMAAFSDKRSSWPCGLVDSLPPPQGPGVARIYVVFHSGAVGVFLLSPSRFRKQALPLPHFRRDKVNTIRPTFFFSISFLVPMGICLFPLLPFRKKVRSLSPLFSFFFRSKSVVGFSPPQGPEELRCCCDSFSGRDLFPPRFRISTPTIFD